MDIEKKGSVRYFAPAWAKRKNALAGFTCRNGGVSRPPFHSLNFGYHTEDLPANVEGNRSTFSRLFDYEPHQLLTVNQVHGESVLVIDSENYDFTHFQTIEADAIVTNQANLLLGIMVADCYPVLLFDAEHQVVAAIHIGWKGAANGLIEKTIASMTRFFDTKPENIYAAIGAGIGAHAYEVDRPVRDEFKKTSDIWDDITTEVSLGKWMLDLKKCCQMQLQQAGVTIGHAEAVKECTCCNQEIFFSYRRDEGKTGRQLGFIGLK